MESLCSAWPLSYHSGGRSRRRGARPPQSFEFWHALRTLGVKTKLVVYPEEGHRISKPEHRRDIARRLVMWFDDHL
jgi:dipeptidyl aminopeptidase/acylaminoacyl peptidase